MTRKWRDHKSLVQLVRLFLIDEVHQLNDESRGPTMEAIVSRMKTIRSSISWEEEEKRGEGGGGGGGGGTGDILRFIAISATIPNITDVSEANSYRPTMMVYNYLSSSAGCLLAWIGRATSTGVHVSNNIIRILPVAFFTFCSYDSLPLPFLLLPRAYLPSPSPSLVPPSISLPSPSQPLPSLLNLPLSHFSSRHHHPSHLNLHNFHPHQFLLTPPRLLSPLHLYLPLPRIDESHRPVRLRRVVLGYPDASTEFKFDLSLNYRISSAIQCYSEQKPTLVVCH